jgi:hypothetical protein
VRDKLLRKQKHDAYRAGAIGNRKNSLLQIFSNGSLNENHGKEMFRTTNHPESYLQAPGNEVPQKKGEASHFAFHFL